EPSTKPYDRVVGRDGFNVGRDAERGETIDEVPVLVTGDGAGDEEIAPVPDIGEQSLPGGFAERLRGRKNDEFGGAEQALRESTWQALLAYVRNGGNLLVTGPVSRDEHWHLVDRLTPLGISAHIEPLTFHYANVIPDDVDSKQARNVGHFPVSFDQNKQQLLEYLRFDKGTTYMESPL